MALRLDHVDRAIIQALKEDGRAPYSRIAEQLGVSPGMIRQRVQRLNEREILQVVAVTNPLKIGYHTMALIGVKADGYRLQEIARKIAEFEEVIYLTICSAAYNLLVEVVCVDNSHLLTFLTERLYSVEGVRDTETFIYLDIVKEIYAWDSPAPSPLEEDSMHAPDLHNQDPHPLDLHSQNNDSQDDSGQDDNAQSEARQHHRSPP